MKVLVKNNELVDSIRSWDASYYINKLMFYGYSVSLPILEPVESLEFGDLKILNVIEIKDSIDSAKEEYTDPTIIISDVSVTLTYGKKNKQIIEVPPEPEPAPSINAPYSSDSGKYYTEAMVIERKQYENKYMILTKQIMQLAGLSVEDDVWSKLEDKDYENVGLQACINNPGLGNFLITSLSYVHRTLKTDFEWSWDKIQFRPEVL